jgi:hypothetical protein
MKYRFKQLTGVEACQCRHGRIQRNHEDETAPGQGAARYVRIACAFLVGNCLKNIAYRSRLFDSCLNILWFQRLLDAHAIAKYVSNRKRSPMIWIVTY